MLWRPALQPHSRMHRYHDVGWADGGHGDLWGPLQLHVERCSRLAPLPGTNCSLLGLHVEWDEARALEEKHNVVWSFLD